MLPLVSEFLLATAAVATPTQVQIETQFEFANGDLFEVGQAVDISFTAVPTDEFFIFDDFTLDIPEVGFSFSASVVQYYWADGRLVVSVTEPNVLHDEQRYKVGFSAMFLPTGSTGDFNDQFHFDEWSISLEGMTDSTTGPPTGVRDSFTGAIAIIDSIWVTVPEPSVLGLLLPGTVVLLGLRRRRQG